MSEAFDPYQEWLGIPPHEQPPHHYRLLGVRAFENDVQAIDQAADARMKQLRSAQIGQHAAQSQRLLNEVATARACLVNPRRRAEYDATLKQRFGELQIASPTAGPTSTGLTPLPETTPAGDVALLTDLPSADPIHSAPLVGTYVPDASYPTGRPYPSAKYMAASAPYVSSRRTSPNPLLWVFLGVGAFALVACIAVGVILAGVFSSRDTVADDGAVAQDGRPALPDTPSVRENSTPPAKPKDFATAALVDRMRREGALLIYTFEPESLFSENGKRRIRDYSGHELHGVLEGASPPQTTSAGTTGSAMAFNGRTSRIAIPGLRSELGKDRKAFTLSAWIKPAPAQQGTVLFDVGFYGSDSLTLNVRGNQIGFLFAAKRGGETIEAPWDERLAWRHVAAVWDGKQQRLYVDGRLAGSKPTTLKALTVKTLTQPNGESYEARLGVTAKDAFSRSRYFLGEIDDLVLLPRAFSAAEVKALSESSPSRSTTIASGENTPKPNPPVPGDVRVVDLISLVDIQTDARPTEKWKRSSEGLPEIVDGFGRPKLIFPYEPPEEYDVEVAFSQPKLGAPISLILPKSGTSFYFIAGGSKGVAAFSVTSNDNPTASWDAQRVAPGRVHKMLVQVRNDGVKGYLDGVLVSEHQTDFRDMKVDIYRTIKETKQIAVDADDPTVFHSVKLTEVSGPGRFIRPPASAPPEPGSVAGTPVETPPKTPALSTEGNVVNLVSLVDLSQDAMQAKKWAIEDGLLKLKEMHLRPKVVFPYEPPQEYDVKVVFSQPKPRNGVAVIMPNGTGDSFFWCVGGNAKLSVAASQNPTVTRLEGGVQRDKVHTTIVQVRRDGVKGFFDGELVVEYTAGFENLKVDSNWFRIRQKTQIAVDADDPTTFYSIELTEVSGPGRLTRPR